MLALLETKIFSRVVGENLTDEEYAALQWRLASDPAAVDLVRNSGDVRKVRWGVSGRGKSDGVRVVYYARTHLGEIWLSTTYAETVAESIPASILRQVREEIDGLSEAQRRARDSRRHSRDEARRAWSRGQGTSRG